VTRRKLLFSAAGAASCLVYPRLLEPQWLEVTRQSVRMKHPLTRGPIRLLHLSDLHASEVVPISMIEHAIALGLAEKPDVICVTGDFITDRSEHPGAEYARALRKLRDAAPTFAVLGNHDGGVWSASRRGYHDHRVVESILAEAGMELLHNRSRVVTVGEHSISLVGVGD
jgi:predicted MPP superfamily phosphohydrolase